MAPSTNVKYSKNTIRIATTALFLAQGLCFATWASRLLDIRNQHGITDDGIYAILMFIVPLGKFIAIPLVGYLLPRLGSKKTFMISILPYALSLMLIDQFPTIYGLGFALLLFGTFWNMTDISLNTQAIEVERLYGKSIIATFHASWSFAAVIGALIGYFMVVDNIPTTIHFGSIMVIAVIAILVSYKYSPAFTPSSQNKEKGESIIGKGGIRVERLLVLLGLMWLITLIVENTMFEWSNLYFESVIKAPKTLQVGFLVFMVMMFIGRLLTNFAYRFLSKVKILQIAGALMFIGFTISSLFIGYSDTMEVKAIIISVGFMLIGLGISCLVPTLYSIVGEKAKTPVGTALTIMSSISFVGPLIAPLLVGGISREFGMQWAYLVVGLLGACIMIIPTISKTLKK